MHTLRIHSLTGNYTAVDTAIDNKVYTILVHSHNCFSSQTAATVTDMCQQAHNLMFDCDGDRCGRSGDTYVEGGGDANLGLPRVSAMSSSDAVRGLGRTLTISTCGIGADLCGDLSLTGMDRVGSRRAYGDSPVGCGPRPRFGEVAAAMSRGLRKSALHTGHWKPRCSHCSAHAVWNLWSHGGNTVNTSPSAYFSRQMEQVSSLVRSG